MITRKKTIYRCTVVLLFTLAFVNAAFAQAESEDEAFESDSAQLPDEPPQKNTFHSSFENHYLTDPDRPRSGWLPMLSFLLPGLDQAIQGQYISAATYASYGLFGFSLIKAAQDKSKNPGQADITSRDNYKRQLLLGSQMYELAGAMSAYQSYRSIINVYREHGVGYMFIKADETSLDLLAAPFDFRFLARSTTWAPLAALIGGILLAPKDKASANYINGTDIGYLSAFSIQAGVAEESVFRGAFLPSMREWWGSDLWSNTAQATVFAALHISSQNPVPLPQFALGWYFGWLTQHNNYSIRENIFIHVWWDIIAFTSTYLGQTNSDRRNIYVPVIDATF